MSKRRAFRIQRTTLLLAAGGLAWLDPAALAGPNSAPPVHVQSLIADGKGYATDSPPTLAPQNRRVALSYSATALSTPERVRFRYRLVGLDKDWQDAGTRRVANFNDLPPGAYRFEVEASDEYGAWNGKTAALAFEVAPAWFQTLGFRLACAAAALSALWGALRLREAQLVSQIMAREEAKQLERHRIARDLHDTFLQSVEGLLHQFQALAARIPSQDPIRTQLHHALELADKVIDEGRDRVIGLRHMGGHGQRLSRELHSAWTEASGSDGQVITVNVHGEELPLMAGVRDEVFQILREALVNAREHAQASQVTLDLHYGRDRCFIATVADNGVGLPKRVLEKGTPDHSGLSRMRESAAKAGATLSIRSGADVGTTVELSLERRAAFEDSRG